MSTRPIEIGDLFRIRFPHHAALSPDGTRALYALGRLGQEANEIRSNLWLVNAAGGEAQPFTADEGRDTSPRWSPDGRWIAFLSNRAGRRRGRKAPASQLWVMPAGGGEARQLTFFRSGVTQLAWAPDGRSLVFTSRGTLDRLEEAEDEEVIVREITRVKYKFDMLGFLEGYAHLWIVSLDGGEPVRLTDGDFDHDSPAWLPGTREVVFVSNRTREADLSFVRDVWAVDVQTRALRQLTHNAGPCIAPTPSPDGRWVAFVGNDFHARSATNAGIWLVPAAGGETTNLTAKFDRSVGNMVGTDVRIVPLFPSIGWIDNGRVAFYACDSGQTHLYSVTAPGGEVRQLTQGVEVIDGLGAAGGRVIYQRITPAGLDELWVWDEEAGPRRLLTPNEDLLRDLAVGEPERFRYTGVDGWPMDGWVLTPPGFDRSRRYPAILRIHGGPHSAYGDAFSHYVHLLAARGYVIVWTNPRGSGGYGEEFTKAVVEDWGGKDSQDILLGLDEVVSRGFVDPDRIAVTGGSYGGFMTNWMITHTDRFRSAVTEVCVSNLHAFYGTSDIGATWGELEWGGNPWDDAEKLWAHSPLAYVKNVTTPVLIIANEADHRCPIEQSEQFYIALRKLGKEAVFLRFLDSSHTMGSSGKPRQRVERLRRILAWFDRYLEPARTTDTTPQETERVGVV